MELQKTEKIFQWHGETFDIPKSTSHLAFSPLCANQAFRYGTKVYGFQFHMEVDAPMIHRWLKVVDNRIEISNLHGAEHIDFIYSETPRHIGRLGEISDRVFGAFIDLFGIEKKFRRLPSR
jgi:GMP synthase (glutamine-hydrolysing)